MQSHLGYLELQINHFYICKIFFCAKEAIYEIIVVRFIGALTYSGVQMLQTTTEDTVLH